MSVSSYNIVTISYPAAQDEFASRSGRIEDNGKVALVREVE